MPFFFHFHVGYDCPYFPFLPEFILLVSGGSVSAARALRRGSNKKDNVTTAAINWFGGWHHAKRERAEGFCYVNDIGEENLLVFFGNFYIYVKLWETATGAKFNEQGFFLKKTFLIASSYELRNASQWPMGTL